MIDLSNLFLVAGAALLVFIIFAMMRALLGPTVPDRAVALDIVNTLVIAAMILLSAGYKSIIYVDVAIVYAILSFIGTLYIAKYLEGGP
ncbi:MAG: monovalent cation/H+ antiporter complex subunit F [Candidatus Thermoplasmatota archaeon]|nr:monovalent cation/H+ antiporter complex subunit F [Candidatus Thermoplasmatota archaeon]MDI6855984.1 monovalent cation/H+ antiporter complex subunit F [Candidatus Thermoplasmatota archaeon]MDI6887740.1 monovalent cation/H+ antiporter complex subunit F [Candidatus Thermoplasmatota archaeon]